MPNLTTFCRPSDTEEFHSPVALTTRGARLTQKDQHFKHAQPNRAERLQHADKDTVKEITKITRVKECQETSFCTNMCTEDAATNNEGEPRQQQ